ncbi:MAG: MBL fold metallo-hydrolase [Chloroflexota bacterium]
MNTTSYSKYLFQLTRLVAFNCQLVREDDGFTLIDTDLAGSAESIIEAAQKLGTPIRRIALTHDHGDHVGSLDKLHSLLPDVEVVMSARDARFMAGDMSLDPDEPQFKLRGSYQVCTTKPDRLLKPGDRVGSLEVVASPGHTPGHISFLDHRDGTLIAGDAYTTQAGISTAGVFRLLFPFMAMAYWHRPTALATAKNLCDLAPKRLAVGHGKALDNPIADMKRAIAEAEQKIGK